MSQDFSFSHLLSGGNPVYALQSDAGPINVHWGQADPQLSESLHYRKFHHPKKKSPTIWNDFPETATLKLRGARSYKRKQLSDLPPIARPGKAFQADHFSWNRLCKKVEAVIENGEAFKIVPARMISVKLSADERKALLASLCHRLFFPVLENAHRFLVKSGSSIFFGATPELLFRREQGEIQVPAIAGTRALGGGIPESSLREELLASSKDRAEHDWVVDGIMDSLKSLGLHPKSASSPQVLRTSRLLHLYTPITAEDSVLVSSEDLLEALHPTPAIGGQPKTAAANFLLENEEWDRGLFSAPLLFRTPGRELCLVAIRSGLITASELHFFAGAGFVKGSTADSEWQETERKLQVMDSLLFGDANAGK